MYSANVPICLDQVSLAVAAEFASPAGPPAVASDAQRDIASTCEQSYQLAERVFVGQILLKLAEGVMTLRFEDVDDVAVGEDNNGVAVFADFGVGLGVLLNRAKSGGSTGSAGTAA